MYIGLITEGNEQVTMKITNLEQNPKSAKSLQISIAPYTSLITYHKNSHMSTTTQLR